MVTNHPEDLADAGLPPRRAGRRRRRPYSGPLGALATAMSPATQDWVLLAAADMPWIEPGSHRLLWSSRGGVDAVVPRTEGGLEPLLALYCDVRARHARTLLIKECARPAELLERVRTSEIGAAELRKADPELASFVNVNTPEELTTAKREIGRL